MTANIAFALAAAALSLAIVVGAGIKGDWAVVAVYTMLVIGFIARASYGRRARRDAQTPPLATRGPAHEPDRQLTRARFKRR